MLKALILPAYNEASHIEDMVRRGSRYADIVIVIDNCSSDRTFELARSAGAIAIRHCHNLGKAGSLKTGCEAALRLKADVIAFMDSDGQHKPEDLPRFFDAVTKEGFDIVIGSRKRDANMPTIRRVGNAALMMTSKVLYGLDVQDIQSGFRVFRAGIYDRIRWTSTGSSHYFADAEITVRMGRAGLKYRELPIETIYHDENKGMDSLEGLRLLWSLVKWRFLI